MTRAYGLGELPGTSLVEAADLVIGETGDLPHLPQLPDRGLGSDVVGRTAALAEWIHVDRGPRSWVMSPRPQLLSRASRDRLEADLDDCEQVWGTSLDTVKVQLLGPWTMAARVELAGGHRVLTDRGALGDLTEALTQAALEHVADVEKRFGARVILQVDEPDLPGVVAGTLRGTSDLDEIRPVHAHDVAERLHGLITAVDGEVLLNMTGYAPLWEVAAKAGADTVLTTVDTIRGGAQFDGFGEAITGGLRLGLGLGLGVKATGDVVDEAGERPRALAVRLARFFDELGVERSYLSDRVDVHPRGGLAGGTMGEAAQAYRFIAAVAGMLERDSVNL